MSETIKISRIDWRRTLIGMEIGQKIEKKRPTVRLHNLVRTWATMVKKETGNVYKVSIKDDRLTITRLS